MSSPAATLARLYRQRWSIERAFLHLTTHLRCAAHGAEIEQSLLRHAMASKPV